MHVYAGNLLMTNGAYDDASKAFSQAYELTLICAKNSPQDCVNNSSKIKAVHKQSLYQRARCFIALNDMDNALLDIVKLAEFCKDDLMINIDKKMLEILKKASLLKPSDSELYKNFIPQIEDVLTLEKEFTRTNTNKFSKDRQIKVSDLLKIPSAYNENIFSKEDLFLYKAVIYFYSEDFENAIKVIII